MHLAGHMRPASRVFETPVLEGRVVKQQQISKKRFTQVASESAKLDDIIYEDPWIYCHWCLQANCIYVSQIISETLGITGNACDICIAFDIGFPFCLI
jgi:hypothetical protein